MTTNIKTIWFSILLFLISLLVAGCSHQASEPITAPPDLLKVTIQQGIAGRIWFWEGNFMPTNLGTFGKISPVIRKVFVYTPTRFDSVKQVGYSPFYSCIMTTLVSTASSNDSGFFQISLPPGRYSLFEQEDTLFYSNYFDGYGYIHPATVAQDSVTMVTIDITYKASF